VTVEDPESGTELHLSGCWLVDEETAKADGAAVLAIMFLGDGLMIFFHLFEAQGQPPATETRINTYWLDGERMFVATPPWREDHVWEQRWELTDRNALFLGIGRDWVPFHPSTIERLLARGFERYQIEKFLALAEMTKEYFYEEPPFLRPVPWRGMRRPPLQR
jgi:hypothetical protein